MIIRISIFFFGAVLATKAQDEVKQQDGYAAIAAKEKHDQESAGTGLAQAVQAGSKYFQYEHVPSKDQYEHGHRRGNDHHFVERHEKGHPHAGEFKTKLRWGDKHGGYGEHYWDYNHGGNDHEGDGAETQEDGEYTAYEGSEQVPIVDKPKFRRGIPKDVEYINEKARSLVERGTSSKHGGNYKRQPLY